MAIYHFTTKVFSRSTRNTVGAVAYRAGVYLKCERTGLEFDYRKKLVQHVELILPQESPVWAKELQSLIQEDRQKGVKAFSDLAEAAEKRVDAQVYREFEFALPKELTDEQNIVLAGEFLQDQCAGLGITVLSAFHFEVDEETGEPRPHCHAILLTRELTEEGLSPLKNREWNKKKQLLIWREQWAQYANFHLKLHGFHQRVDHRSYADQGIEMEPQPKLSRGVQEREKRSKSRKPVTDKYQAFQESRLRNLYRLLKDPTLVFKIATRTQVTFTWEEVQKILFRYVDDPQLFQRLEQKLLHSSERVDLGKEGKNGALLFTTRTLVKLEKDVIDRALKLSETKSHRVRERVLQSILKKKDKEYGSRGGLSKDQKKAIEYMASPRSLICIEGYAGAGKTTALKVATEIWKKEGYQVIGLGSTGKAAQNFKEFGISFMTADTFLKNYEKGRCHYRASTVLILDEAGMLPVRAFHDLLGAVQKQKVKLVLVGDTQQLQPVEAGNAFKLMTDRVSSYSLEAVIRQEIPWQREATVHFGQGHPQKALEAYFEQGAFTFVDEKVPSFNPENPREVVELYILARRMVGQIYSEMKEEAEALLEEEGEKPNLKDHEDYKLFKQWKALRAQCSSFIFDHVALCTPFIKEFNVDPLQLALLTFPQGGREFKDPREMALWAAQRLGLPLDLKVQGSPLCDPRKATREELVKAWAREVALRPQESHVILAYANRDTDDLNFQARLWMRELKKIQGEEVIYQICYEGQDDFGRRSMERAEKSFAQGDRVIFFKNDKGLKLQNGLMGTIVSLTKTKVKVKVDQEDRVVSFAPKLYPYFDHGWAVTVHKSQGMTVDRTYVLASFQLFRNLAYVAMSRHRKDVKVFGSTLDFWRPEKVLDILSKSQEKTSSFDYLTASQIQTLIREEEGFLTRFLERTQNQIYAAKYVSQEAFKEMKAWFLRPQKEAALSSNSADSSQALEPSLKAPLEKPTLDLTLEPLKGLSQETSHSLKVGEPSVQEKVLKDSELQKPPEILPTSEALPEKQETGDQDEKKRGEAEEKKNAQALLRKEILEDLSQGMNLKRLSQDLIPDFKREVKGILEFKGGVKVDLQKGQWYSFTEAQGGGALQLIQHYGGAQTFKEALQLARDYAESALLKEKIETYLGEGPLNFELKNRKEKPPERVSLQEASQAEALLKIKGAQDLFEKSIKIDGTPAETYLKQERGIQGELPDSLRYVPPGTTFTYNGEQKKVLTGALLSIAQDKDGELRAVQVTYLKGGKRLRNKEGQKLNKMMYGASQGAFVMLQKEEGPIYLAEGVETGLSIKEAGVQGTLLASLGVHNLKNLTLPGKEVFLCADYDGQGAQSHDLLLKAKEGLQERGYDVQVLWPAQEGNQKIDFNDILIKEGKEKVVSLLENQTHIALKPSSHELIHLYELASFQREIYSRVPEKDRTPHEHKELETYTRESLHWAQEIKKDAPAYHLALEKGLQEKLEQDAPDMTPPEKTTALQKKPLVLPVLKKEIKAPALDQDSGLGWD